MILLISGLILWSVVHLMPSVGMGVRRMLIGRVGERSYSGMAAVLIIVSLVLVVFGWRSIAPVLVYEPLESLGSVSLLLMLLAMMLFVASSHATRIKRFVRHPQLTSIAVWSVAHLLQNGDERSIVLFGWLGIWSILEMILINRREGGWVKAEPPSWAIEARYVVVSLVVFAVVLFAHPYISGVTIM